MPPSVPAYSAHPAPHGVGGGVGQSMASALHPAIIGGTSEAVNLQALAPPHQNGYSHGGSVHVQPLAAGWQEAVDTTSGHVFYQNHLTHATYSHGGAVQDQPLPAGWQEAVNTASGHVYYQNHLTHATQWMRPTEQNQGMVTGSHFGQLVIDINGGAFGILPKISVMNASAISGSSGPAHLVVDDQTNDPNQTLEKKATRFDKCMAFVSFFSDLGSRAAFIIPALLKGSTAGFGLYLYTIDLVLLACYAYKARYQEAHYCPGCLYNNLHVLIKGKKLEPCFVSIKTKRFSGTEKFIVGIGSLATLVNVVEGVSDIWCAWDKGGGNIL